ncbi:MAG TPA: RHS repeat-associated core domain-containing protein [Kribbellaceae bacterium]|nr:RHS repeat-associated core domain-containing protein [Kribbellaceae bacterium]
MRIVRETLYLPGGTELRHATGQTTSTRYYTHAGQIIAVRTTAGGLTWLTADQHGTGTHAINPGTLTVQQRRTLPFGAPRGTAPSDWPGDRGFVGGPTDPTGMTHLGAREYDPTTGRFISLDPVIDNNDPQQMNGYTYATNNPTTTSDPTGLTPNVCLEECGSTDDQQFQKDRREQKKTAEQQGKVECKVMGECPQPQGPDPKEILARGVALSNDLVIAPSAEELEAALQEAEDDLCPWYTFLCQGRAEPDWEAHAHNYICGAHPDWCSDTGTRAILQEGGGGKLVEKLLLPAGLRVGANAKTDYYVYLAIRGGQPVYVGITNNVGRREYEHALNDRGFDGLRVIGKGMTRGEARAVEQALIERNRGVYENVMNGISPRRGAYHRDAVRWGEAWLKRNGY